MNRFFRSALFPLVIIAALVWLALQTLGGHMWNHPAISGRLLLLRNNGEAACYQLPTADEAPATKAATNPAE